MFERDNISEKQSITLSEPIRNTKTHENQIDEENHKGIDPTELMDPNDLIN